jgi:3-deoxy-D-manno-oct-2-ulosonic acid (Kdo) hydroxylase
MNPIFVIDASDWNQGFSPDQQTAAVEALEQGHVLFFPNLACPVSPARSRFLTPDVLDQSKNVSYDAATGAVSGTKCTGEEATELADMIGGFSRRATTLLNNLLPAYVGGLRRGRASLRPVEVSGRVQSWRKDDTRLHVDSFPSQPTNGKRLLRLFSNVNPTCKPRRWRVGEPFAAVARRFWPRLRSPLPGSSLLLRLFHVTKTTRSGYDHFMLQLHDAMKSDQDYQKRAEQLVQDFPAGTTWVCYTDQVSHAALAGQHQFEQTFRLPVKRMHDAATSPLRVLEELAGHSLV